MKDITSPNSFHFEQGVMKPGLGADEPTDKAKKEAAESAEKYRMQQVALQNAEAAIREEALALEKRAAEAARLEEDRAAAFEKKMQELEERERALEEKENSK